ncbi:MAG: hypothetical protein GF353_21610 [Candidatus Lokiarchaeota archaeon]|nr:hypothetical protein [Candidatus Lokiarchaeota archaeon]
MENITKHRFLDEAGDTTFYGKGKKCIVGNEGVSKSFIIGMVKFRQSLTEIRKQIIELQKKVETDPYYKGVPSILKKVEKGGYFFHAKDDLPEVRKTFYDFIKTIDCSFEAVVARKINDIFIKKHNTKDAEFYADILSHLLKNKLEMNDKLVLNIAERGSSTRHKTLQSALDKATRRFNKKYPAKKINTVVVFNVQNPRTEPLLNIADYFCWSIQRVFERGEIRFYENLKDQISLVVDLYDSEKWEGSKNYYTIKNPLTAQNEISPPLH